MEVWTNIRKTGIDTAAIIPSTSSPTSNNTGHSSAPLLEDYDDFMDRWEASLAPNQRSMFRVMLRAAQKVVSQLIDCEKVIDDLAASYGSSLGTLFKDLVAVERNIVEQKRMRSLEILQNFVGSMEEQLDVASAARELRNHL